MSRTASLRIALLSLVIGALASGCPGPAPATDGGADAPAADAPSIACTTAADCDDGLYCTGTEACTAGRCVTTPVECDDGVACTTDRCSEERLRCVNDPPDVDGDGYFDAACLDADGDPLGNDCADDDAMRYPGNREVCDASHDEDCDDTTLGAIDDDSDGFVSTACCNGTSCGDDCDDARDGTYPGATEVCDGLDQDCDGTADDGVALMGFEDRDRDGWGDSTMPRLACADAAGWVPDDRGGDCNDDPASTSARAQNPGQPEICDGIRNDCSTTLAADVGAGAVDWYGDMDGDGFGSATTSVTSSCTPVSGSVLLSTDCDDMRAASSPAAAETCNGRDDDCNGAADFRIADNDFEDDDGDGLIDSACTGGTDCNDRDASSGPGELERCDGRDNDCDTIVDEGATSLVYYRDADADGYGSAASGSIVACMPSAGFVVRGGDCNDSDTTRYPGADERCNAADEDCDAAIDEAPASSTCPARPGVTASTCFVGRCSVDTCVAGRGDCNARETDGCEVTLASDERNCGTCGIACSTGETCTAGTCECDATALACPGGCVDPSIDERFCGAFGSCTTFERGTECRAGEFCNVGECLRSEIFPGTAQALTRVRAVTYTLDAPVPATIEYTLDGSTPGSSPTTISAPAPVDVLLDGTTGAVTIRWRARYATGEVESLQAFTHSVDTTSGPGPDSPFPIDNMGAIVENMEINGSGPIAVVAPGSTVNFSADVRHWRQGPTGFCPTCDVWTSINFGPAANIATCVGNTGSPYPGTLATGVTGSFVAPMFAGVYPLVVHLAWDFVCTGGGGETVGWVLVDGPISGG